MNISYIVFINEKLPLAKGNEHLCHFKQISRPARVGKSVSSVVCLVGSPSSSLLMEDQLHLTACNRVISIVFFLEGGEGGTKQTKKKPKHKPTQLTGGSFVKWS